MTARAARRLAIVSLSVAVLAVAAPSGAATAQTTPDRRPLSDVTTAEIALPGDSPGVIDTPFMIAASPDAVWVASHRSGRVDRIDPATNRVVASIDLPVPGCGPGGCLGLENVVADERSVWVVNNQAAQLVHIDARTNQVVGTLTTNGFVEDLVIDGDSVWVAPSHSGDVVRVSARTNEVVERVHVSTTPAWPIAIVHGALWVGSDVGLHRVDRATGKVTATVRKVTGSGAVVVDGDLWIAGCTWKAAGPAPTCPPGVVRVDGRTGAPRASVELGGVGVNGLSTEGRRSLVASVEQGPGGDNWLTVVDTRRAAIVARYDPFPSKAPAGVAYGHGSLWVTNWTPNTVSRVALPEPASH